MQTKVAYPQIHIPTQIPNPTDPELSNTDAG